MNDRLPERLPGPAWPEPCPDCDGSGWREATVGEVQRGDYWIRGGGYYKPCCYVPESDPDRARDERRDRELEGWD